MYDYFFKKLAVIQYHFTSSFCIYTILHPHLQYMKDSVSLYLCLANMLAPYVYISFRCTIIQCFYTLHSILNYCKLMAIFLCIVHMFIYLIYFTHSNLCLLIPYPYLAPFPFPLPTGNLQFVFYICKSVSVNLVEYSYVYSF